MSKTRSPSGASRKHAARARETLKLTAKLLEGAEGELFAGIVRAIERKNKCVIAIRPVESNNAGKALRPGQALTVSRPFRVEVTYPYPEGDPKTIVFWEHMVVYDVSRGRDLAQKAIAHELGHIAIHLDQKPEPEDFERVQTTWTEDEECDADMMALCLMKFCQPESKAKRRPFLRDDELVELVREYGKLKGVRLKGICEDWRAVDELLKDGLLKRLPPRGW